MDEPTQPLTPAVPATAVAKPKSDAKPKDDAQPEALPQSGGTWERDASGGLRQTVFPTRPPAPPGKAYASPDDAGDLTLVDAPDEAKPKE
jgi:hypothetical protein